MSSEWCVLQGYREVPEYEGLLSTSASEGGREEDYEIIAIPLTIQVYTLNTTAGIG